MTKTTDEKDLAFLHEQELLTISTVAYVSNKDVKEEEVRKIQVWISKQMQIFWSIQEMFLGKRTITMKDGKVELKAPSVEQQKTLKKAFSVLLNGV